MSTTDSIAARPRAVIHFAAMFGFLKNALGLGDDPETAEAKRRMQAVAHDPRCRFVQGMLLVSYEVDPAYLREHSQEAVRDWYGCADRTALVASIERFLVCNDRAPGYDAFRACFLARAGEGARMISDAESWELAFRAGRRAQQICAGWRGYGMGYLEGHLAFRQQKGDSPSTLAQYRQNILNRIADRERGIWAATPFTTPL